MRTVRLILAIAVVGLVGVASARAGLRREQVDTIVQPAMRIAGIKGCVVGLVDGDGRQVFGYGVVRDGGATTDGRTVFEIGSVTKVFTALLLEQKSEAGEVRLDQAVTDLLPEGVRVPSKDGVQITLLHLTSQTSGLPRMPENFDPADGSDPYADYDARRLYDALNTLKLSRKPGEKYAYSNLGVGLLGHVLALKANTTYERMLLDRICTPLGMTQTRLTMDDDMRKRLAQGHDPAGQPVRDWSFDTLAGAGAIKSTADDMLTFLAANLGLLDSPVVAAMKATHARRAATDDPRTDIAMGWLIGKRTGARWHNGQTGGYHSFVAFVPDKRIGVVVLSNGSSGVIDTVGTQLIQVMLGEDVEPLVVPQMRPAVTPSTRTTSSASPTP